MFVCCCFYGYRKPFLHQDKVETGDHEELSLQGIVDAPILKLVPQEAQILTSYVANKALFWLVTDVLEIAAGVSLKWDPTSITLAQIKKQLVDLQKDMNVLLDADFQTAFKRLEYAAIALKHENYESVFSELEKVLDYSVRAFTQVKTFRKRVFCKKMTIYSMRMIQCYNMEKKEFEDLNSLPIKKQKELAEKVISDVDVIIDEFQNMKEPNFWQRKVNNAKKKTEEHYVLDRLLKAALPIIWHHHEVFKIKGCEDKDMLKYVPNCEEDSAEILLEGKWPIKVWKGYKALRFDFRDKNAVDEGIRRTNFHCISSKPLCKYFKVRMVYFRIA